MGRLWFNVSKFVSDLVLDSQRLWADYSVVGSGSGFSLLQSFEPFTWQLTLREEAKDLYWNDDGWQEEELSEKTARYVSPCLECI